MKIGILKESAGENRVAMLPDGASALAGLKVSVLVEKDAGKGASVPDKLYEEAGASLLSRAEVIKQADVLLMINDPGKTEVNKFKKGQVVVAAVNPLSNHDAVKSFRDAEVSLFSLDVIPRMSMA